MLRPRVRLWTWPVMAPGFDGVRPRRGGVVKRWGIVVESARIGFREALRPFGGYIRRNRGRRARRSLRAETLAQNARIVGTSIAELTVRGPAASL